MRNFLLLCMAALCCLACNDSKIVTVTVTNPLAMDRSDEMVEVSMTEISNLLNLADTAQIVVLNVEGEQVPYQVTYDDKLIFPATVAANASAAYTVQAGTPVDVEVRACGRQYPEALLHRYWKTCMPRNWMQTPGSRLMNCARQTRRQPMSWYAHSPII